MMDYQWEISPQISQLLIQLEAAKLVFTTHPPDQHLIESLTSRSLLKSAVYSARIEGIPSTESQPRKEAQNLLSAYKYLDSRAPQSLNLNFIKKLHQITLKSISSTSGQFRSGPWAVFNPSGVAIHIAPLHTLIPHLMASYVNYINRLPQHPAVVAAVAQFIFEKLHPFADGNGRVGRLISAYLLKKSSLHFNFAVSIEEYIEKHREGYYHALQPSHRITEFIEFFLTGLVSESQDLQLRLTQKPSQTSPLPLPRRQELMDIIKDHPLCTFDFLSRRFPSVNPKTLHHDLLWLQSNGHVKKHGVTRSTVYSVV